MFDPKKMISPEPPELPEHLKLNPSPSLRYQVDGLDDLPEDEQQQILAMMRTPEKPSTPRPT